MGFQSRGLLASGLFCGLLFRWQWCLDEEILVVRKLQSIEFWFVRLVLGKADPFPPKNLGSGHGYGPSLRGYMSKRMIHLALWVLV
jgi:hypothetical protein